jgi:flagellar hook-basal body complex protein FliE
MIPPIGSLGSRIVEGAGASLGNLDDNDTQTTTGVGTSFATMLGAAAKRVGDNLNNAEQLSLKALQGDADTRTVVDAVMSAEQSLQAAVAIRDKVVSAYLEISRMAI